MNDTIDKRWIQKCDLCNKEKKPGDCWTDDHMYPPDLTFTWCPECEKKGPECDALMCTAIRNWRKTQEDKKTKNRIVPRYLAKWERLETNWDLSIAELKICPDLVELRQYREHVVIELKIDGKILPFPKMGRSIADNNTGVIRHVNKYKQEQNVALIPGADITWGHSSHSVGYDSYQVFLKIWMVKYCDYVYRTCNIVDDLALNVKKPILCKVGLHKWDFIEDNPRLLVAHINKYSQKAIKRCKKCGKRKVYYRKGTLYDAVGMELTKWMKCSSMQEKYIDHLPWL